MTGRRGATPAEVEIVSKNVLFHESFSNELRTLLTAPVLKQGALKVYLCHDTYIWTANSQVRTLAAGPIIMLHADNIMSSYSQ